MPSSLTVPTALLLLALAKWDEADAEELARAIKNSDHSAFKAFFEKHHQSLFSYLMSRGTSEETAEDLIQKAFIYIWEHRQRIKPNQSLRAYLFKIAYTRMLNHIRDTKKFEQLETLNKYASGDDPEQQLRAQQLQAAIDRAITELPEKRGLVFEMCFIREFTYRETAEVLNVSIKTVENHMGLALRDIRAAIQNFNPKKDI